VVEVREESVQMSTERRSVERRGACGVQPSVDALEADAAASDRAMAVEAMGSLDWASELAVRAANGLPVGGEAIAAATAAADGGANHVKWPIPHRRLY
jgi:hypothetical protein